LSGKLVILVNWSKKWKCLLSCSSNRYICWIPYYIVA